ncbi:DNA-(apurinic or apyrimidinic site) lyase [Williamsia limnetica]|jgi:formamidopyrimidine-DNA glycosylase|uniref:Formamidopyrimidine-DNA glycosylase n=1 Tax=Williamsia limnetica TaxID=882452 RepID=A0A318RQC0_WILLI|nr:bifunctional DNA-formamidopyrimidine glycosylase/DNA-(apurinic or apyrimidinic site) lyase [Williamsia limnetica]PYE14013.1 DNA-(apurinic or apyrimidinic site) lyase [Williamsia limnetica]
MPELPEVEVVRRGLLGHVVGKRIVAVEVLHPRAVRRQLGGAADLIGLLAGATVTAARRRGKYLWLEADPAAATDPIAILVHLGMSGQMLVQPAGAADEKHLRIRATLDDGTELRFVDQRTFGSWMVDDIVGFVPASIAHIALDPFDPGYDQSAVVDLLRSKHTEIKRALLDQTVVSGVGNIYADEALWRSRIHGQRLTDKLPVKALRAVLDNAAAVMSEALDQGGTSFDALYVNVNGQSGYFERSLNAYGREDKPCRRCGALMRREQFMNRSSFSCPKCQIRPRW